MCNYLLDSDHFNIKHGGKSRVGYKIVTKICSGRYKSFWREEPIKECMSWEYLIGPSALLKYYGFCAFARRKDAEKILEELRKYKTATSANLIIVKVRLSKVVGTFDTYEMSFLKSVKLFLQRNKN